MGSDAELIVVTGPPGAGKSTVAALLAEAYEPSALVVGDEFFRFLRRGYVEPWLPESRDQNVAVVEAAAAASGRLVTGGITVVYDGVVGPWHAPEFLAASGVPAMRYAVLLPDPEVCAERIRTRTGHEFSDLAAAQHMHDEFTQAVSAAPSNVVSDLPDTAAEVADLLRDELTAGRLRYP